MNLLEELEILMETRQPYANGNAEKCYPAVAELIQKLRTDKAQLCACIPPRADTNSMGKCEACGCVRK